MKKIRIFCELPYLIELATENFLVDNSNYLEVQSEKELFFKCYPIDQPKNSLPFCFLLKQKIDKVESNCQNIKIFNFKDRCDVFVEQFVIESTKIVHTSTFAIKNTKYTIVCYEDKIKINCTSGEYIFETPITSVCIDTGFGFLNFLTTFEDKKTYTRFDTSTKKFSSIKGNKIQIEEDKILVQTNFCDILEHTKICEYKNNGSLEYQKTEFYTKRTLDQTNLNNKLLPIVFFESVKLEDYKTAQCILDENLSKNLNQDTIKQFFGDIDAVFLTSKEPLVYTIYCNDNASDYHIYLKDNKIQDIEKI